MKRTERHHLKENELAQSIASAREFVETRTRLLAGVAIAAVVLVAGAGAVVMVRQQSQSRGQGLLAEAMVALNARVVPPSAQAAEDGIPAAAQFGATGAFATENAKLTAALPKLKAAADAYPGSDAGVTARYHLAGALAALGKHVEALKEFDEVARLAGSNTLYARMARLGKADTQVRAGQLDAAIVTWKELASQSTNELPVDAILMELARAYVAKGNTEEARKTFAQLVDQHPNSPYIAEARAELESLKGVS